MRCCSPQLATPRLLVTQGKIGGADARSPQRPPLLPCLHWQSIRLRYTNPWHALLHHTPAAAHAKAPEGQRIPCHGRHSPAARLLLHLLRSAHTAAVAAAALASTHTAAVADRLAWKRAADLLSSARTAAASDCVRSPSASCAATSACAAPPTLTPSHHLGTHALSHHVWSHATCVCRKWHMHAHIMCVFPVRTRPFSAQTHGHYATTRPSKCMRSRVQHSSQAQVCKHVTSTSRPPAAAAGCRGGVPAAPPALANARPWLSAARSGRPPASRQ